MRPRLALALGLFMASTTVIAVVWKQASYYGDHPDFAVGTAQTVELVAMSTPRRAGEATTRTSSVYICWQTDSTVEVLLFTTGSRTVAPGNCVLHEGEAPKEGVVRWLQETFRLGRLEVETTHTIQRVMTPTGVRSAIVVMVRPEIFHAKQHLAGKAHFIPIVDVMASTARTVSAEVLSDRATLQQFLHPWVKTAGKNVSNCGDGNIRAIMQ